MTIISTELDPSAALGMTLIVISTEAQRNGEIHESPLKPFRDDAQTELQQ